MNMNDDGIYPMFPLGTVLLPSAIVPIRLFEPRYLRLYVDVGEAGEFGVTLIERGHEVGGDDARFAVGCAARIVASARQDDESIVAIIAGTQRIRVTEWLRDVPYPQARVEHLGDRPPTDETPALLGECTSAFRMVRALLSELESDVGGEPELSPDPGVAAYQIAHLAPLQELDKQRLLECVDPDERASLLHDYLFDLQALLRLQLGS